MVTISITTEKDRGLISGVQSISRPALASKSKFDQI